MGKLSPAGVRGGVEGRRGKQARLRVVACIGALALIAAATTATAWAAPKSLSGFIGADGGVDTGGLFTQPHDVAFYTAGTPGVADDKILVVERLDNSSRVQRLDRNGNFERTWGKDTIRPGAAGNVGDGFEICVEAISGAAGCKSAPAGSEAGELREPTGIAVDQSTGHVFVMDRGNRRVQEYTLDGDFLRAWGWGVDTGAATFEICTSTCGAGRVGQGEGDANAGQFDAFGEVNSIAISPVAPHDLFVTDAPNRRVLQFEQDGTFIRGWGHDVAPPSGGGFEICEGTGNACQEGQAGLYESNWPRHVAIDADGIAYTSDSTDSHRIVRFDTDPAPSPPDASGALLEPLPSLGLLGTGQTAGLEVDPTTGNLLALRDSTVGTVLSAVREIASPGADASDPPPNPKVADTHTVADEADDASGDVTRGLGADPQTGNLYVGLTALFTAPDGPFTGCDPHGSTTCVGLAVLAHVTAPLAATLDSPSGVGSTSVSLQGVVDAGGGVAQYRFQVSADGQNWVGAGRPQYLAGSGDQGVSTQMSGLEPATLYRTRLLVSKQTDIDQTESIVSNEDIFLTDASAPAVTTLGSTKRTDVSARLRGLVDPQGSATSYRFEYGSAGGAFDHHVPVPNAQAGSGNVPELRLRDVAGLQPDTAYHYRIVATNSVGTAVGESVMFKTKPPVLLPDPPPGRGYELISPADKLSGVGVGIWYQGPSTAGLVGFAAHEADRFAIKGSYGAVLVDGEFSLADDWALAERTPQGWTSKPLMSRRAHGSQTLVFMDETATTPDLSLLAYSNTGLKLFAEQEEWVKEEAGSMAYFRDWDSGKWELFGPTDPIQGGGLGATLRIAVDGRSAVAAAATHGLAGSDDPTLDLPPSVSSVFLDELPTGPSDVFPGTGARSVVNVCTMGTKIPRRVDDGGGNFKLGSQDCPPAAPGRSHALISGDRSADLGSDDEDVISEDGSRVFFHSPAAGATTPCSGVDAGTTCPAQLYVRQRQVGSDFVTRWISRSEVADQDASLMGPAIFEGASDDGDKVFFRTASPLTADDPNGQGQAPPPGGVTTGAPSQGSWDLYMYDMPDAAGADPAAGDLTRISAGPDEQGDCNSPSGGDSQNVGALRFASDDGERLYFICAAPLEGVPLANDGTITSPDGTPSTDNAANLYEYDAGRPMAERWRYVARLPRDSELGACATTGVGPGHPIAPDNKQNPQMAAFPVSCVRGSGDGSFITFFTDGRLTDDDPDAESGDIYAFDADSEELTRISAPQGGVGGSYPCLALVSTPRCYGDDGIGAPAGGSVLPKLGVAEDPDGDRVVFFESRSRLIPADGNAAYDVYEWRDGTLSLISAGSSESEDAFYVGSDRTGTNVYLATRDRLSWQDHDAVFDIYTARVDGGIPEPLTPGETCDAVAGKCQAPGQAPGSTTVGSDEPTAGNPPTTRLVVSLGGFSTKARRRAARSGRLTARVTTNAPTTVTVTAKARVAARIRMVARARTRLASGGGRTVALRLSRAARKRLTAGRRLTLRVATAAVGARSDTAQVTLER